MLKKTIPLLILLIFVGGLFFNGCPGDTTKPPATTAAWRGNTGIIETGKAAAAAAGSVPSSGGTVTVNKPDSPINGLEVVVPAGAYTAPVDFTISAAPIEKQTFGPDCNPLTPMITVDGAVELSGEIMKVTVPVTVPEGQFAMGFIYDADTNKLMGMNTVAQDAASITIATRHFCSFFISAVDKETLKKDIDSGFRPGIDDWQFNNYGSYIASGGHCAGQSVTAIWYYVTQPDGKDLALYGRYDNNGLEPATPDLQYDDSLGYRFVSVVHEDIDWSTWENKFWADMAGVNDALTFNLFAYAMRLTGEPQEIGIYSLAGGGHDMVCYRIFNGQLYIADPNYKGNLDRRIDFHSNNMTFSPYNSGANAEEIAKGNGKAYERIQFCPKNTTIDWKAIAARWQEMKNGTIGDKQFPAYQLKYKDDKGNSVNLPEGYVSPSSKIAISVPSPDGKTVTGCVFYRDGKELKFDQAGNIELLPGNNLIGVYVLGELAKKDSQGRAYYIWRYIDFAYINIIYDALSIDPAGVNAETGEEVYFRAKGSGVKEGNWYTWKVDGAVIQEDTLEMLVTAFDTAGRHTIELEMLDYETGASTTAKAEANITDAEEPTPTSSITTGSRLAVSGSFYIRVATEETGVGADESDEHASFDVEFTGLAWNGNSFSGTSGEWSIKGRLNDDNSIDFDLSCDMLAGGYDDGYDITHITGLPSGGGGVWSAKGLELKKYLAYSWQVTSGALTSRILNIIWDEKYLPGTSIQVTMYD